MLHPARVEPGWSYAVTGGWRAGLCDTLCTAGLVPPMAAYAGYGIVPSDSTGPSFSVAATVPFFVILPAAQVDLYAQAPAAPRALTFGAGVSASVRDVMVYGEMGRSPTERSAWYVVQGLVQAAQRPEPEVLLNGSQGGLFEEFVGSRYWSPQVGYRLETGPAGRNVTVYLAGAFGSEATAEFDGGADRYRRTGSRPVRALMFGAAVGRDDLFRLIW